MNRRTPCLLAALAVPRLAVAEKAAAGPALEGRVSELRTYFAAPGKLDAAWGGPRSGAVRALGGTDVVEHSRAGASERPGVRSGQPKARDRRPRRYGLAAEPPLYYLRSARRQALAQLVGRFQVDQRPSSVASQRCAAPARAAPTIGATQKSHNWASAQPPTKSAGAVLRAGLTQELRAQSA